MKDVEEMDRKGLERVIEISRAVSFLYSCLRRDDFATANDALVIAYGVLGEVAMEVEAREKASLS